MIGQLVAFDHPLMYRLPPVGMHYRDLLDDVLDFSSWGSTRHHPCRSLDLDDVILRQLLSRRSYPPRRNSNRRKNLKAVEKKTEEAERQQQPDAEEKFFRVNLDVSNFRPEELTVKTVGNRLIVHGRHEQKQDERGYVERQFKRTYLLPDDVDPDKVTSSLTASGLLSIEAPKKMAIESTPEILVPIDYKTSTSVGHGSSEVQEPCDSQESSDGLEPCEDQGSSEGQRSSRGQTQSLSLT